MRCLFAILGVFFVLVFSAIVTGWLFYAEEDARGAHEWEVAKRTLQDLGESVNFHDSIPPEVSDHQNLGIIPLFQPASASNSPDSSQTNALREATLNIDPDDYLIPKTGSWLKGETTDFRPIEKYLAERYKKVFDHTESNLGPMEEIDALCPALSEICQASAKRPLCRFPRDYTSTPPFIRSLGSTTSLLRFTKVLDLHTLEALHLNQPDVALDDIKMTLKIDGAVRHEPVLVSGLVAAGIMSIQLGSVWEGLNAHAWTDQQLADLQQQLQEIDFLADYQLCIRGEAIGFLAPTLDYIRDHRTAAALVLTMANTDGSAKRPPLFSRFVSWLVPKGWFDMTKAQGVSLYFDAAREPVDLNGRRVYPQSSEQLKKKGRAVHLYDLPDLLLGVASGPIIGSIGSFAEVQFRVDAASIACALERYRLAYGVYPKSLDALIPYAPQGLPHDLMNGEAYHYKLRPDGTYLLYSVGWDQVDDGGKVAYKTDDPHALDREHGDWVWPSPKMK